MKLLAYGRGTAFSSTVLMSAVAVVRKELLKGPLTGGPAAGTVAEDAANGGHGGRFDWGCIRLRGEVEMTPPEQSGPAAW